MPADDLSLAIRIRADVQQALGGMAKVNDRLGDTGERGREATRSLEGVVRVALEAVDAHEALAGRTQAAFAAMVEDARAAARSRPRPAGAGSTRCARSWSAFARAPTTWPKRPAT